jgi:hypothetical protein
MFSYQHVLSNDAQCGGSASNRKMRATQSIIARNRTRSSPCGHVRRRERLQPSNGQFCAVKYAVASAFCINANVSQLADHDVVASHDVAVIEGADPSIAGIAAIGCGHVHSNDELAAFDLTRHADIIETAPKVGGGVRADQLLSIRKRLVAVEAGRHSDIAEGGQDKEKCCSCDCHLWILFGANPSSAKFRGLLIRVGNRSG